MTALVAVLAALTVLLLPTRGERGALLLSAMTRGADLEHEERGIGGGDDIARSRRAMARMLVAVRSRRSRARDEHELNLTLGSLEAALDAGLTPGDALAAVSSAGDPVGVVGRATAVMARRASAGESVADQWSALAQRPGLSAAAQVGRAWAISERTGAPLARAVGSARASHRRSAALRRSVETQTAGPRATMNLLTALPLAGVVLLPVLGVPFSRAFSPPVLVLAVTPGLGLLLAGRLLTRRMIAHSLAGGPR